MSVCKASVPSFGSLNTRPSGVSGSATTEGARLALHRRNAAQRAAIRFAIPLFFIFAYVSAALGQSTSAQLSAPLPGNVLPGSTVTFSWSAGSSATAYWLYLGTLGPNTANIYSSGSITATTVTVSSIPSNGVNLYATLFSQIGGVWQPTNYTYVEAGTPSLAAMSSPAPGTTLFGPSATFNWSAGGGPTAYALYLGTAGPQSANLYNSGTITTTSATVTGLPTTGATIYATLFSRINGAWQPASYTFTEASPAAPAAIIRPAASSAFTGSSATFSWSPGSQVTAYSLTLGTTGPNSSDLYKSGTIATNSVTVNGLPTLGATVYATLSSQIAGAWQTASYVYTEAPPVLASLALPSGDVPLTGSSAKFVWAPGSGPTAYWLYLGTLGPNTANIYSSGSITGTSVTVSNLPMNGVNLYATLFSKINGNWVAKNYTYTEAGTPALATMTSPAPGASFSGSSATFTWKAGSGPTGYDLYVGTKGPNTADLYNSGALTTTSATVTGIPVTGAPIYVTLFSQINGAWQPIHYTYTELGPPAPAAMLSPTSGTRLSGSTVTFNWTPGSQAQGYWLYLGTLGANTANIYNSGALTGTSVTVSGMPANGVNLYATLFTKLNGTYQPVSYNYTESGTPALASLTSPSPGSILPGASATFSWTAGSGPTAYLLYVGTLGANTANVYSSGSVSGTSATVTSLPTTGAPVYVTLFSEINGAWQAAHYTYTESGGAGEATPSSVSCANSTMTGAGTDSCTVTLNKAAGSAGVDVLLSSNNAAVTLPSIVTVPANSSSVGFVATVTSVTSAATVTLTANSDGTSKTYALQLSPPVSTLTVSASSVPFGSVVVSAPATQTLTLTSTGTGAVTISSAKLSGSSAFSIAGATFPMTLNPKQSAMLNLEFNPSAAGAASGVLTLTSNSSSGTAATVSLSGTGQLSIYQVDLSWDAVTGSAVPIAGYYVFRAPAGSTTYTMMTASADTQTTYTDLTVAAGVTYDYYIESVNTAGVASAPSAIFSVTIP